MEKQANSQKHHFAEARNRSHRSQEHAKPDKTALHTLYEPWKTFVPIQSISNEVCKHAKSWQAQFSTSFCGYVPVDIFSRLGPREFTIQNPKKSLPHTFPVCSLVFENRPKAFISMNQSKTMEIFRFEIFPWLWGFYGIYYGADQKSNHRQAISKTTRQW